MRFAFFFFAFCFVIFTQAQSLKKPFKALNEGQFDEAASGFDEYRLKDSLDPQLWFGYARLFAEPAFKKADLFLSWQYILKSRSLYESLDEKGLKKIGEDLTPDSLNAWQTLIDDRLFERIQIDSSIGICEHHLLDCKLSTHRQSVVVLLNQRAYAQACRINTVASYNHFMISYPTAPEYEEAIVKRASAAARDALLTKTDESCVAFLSEYPDADEAQAVFDTLQELRLRFFMNNISDSLYEVTCFNFYIAESGRYRLDPSLLIRAYDAIRYANSQQYWIYYLSDGSIYRMNERDMKAEDVLIDGKIASFVINSKGEIVFLKETQPKLLTFFLFSGTKAEKLCDFPTKERFTDFDPVVPSFKATADFSYIYFAFGTMPEAGQTRNATFVRAEKKWIVCDVSEDRPCKTPVDVRSLMQVGALISHAKPEQDDSYVTKKVNGVWELFRKDKNDLIQISHTEAFKVRETWGEEVNYMSYSESPKKVFYYFPQECGDFCYGPCFVANLDGSQQVVIETSMYVGDFDIQWLYSSGDLLWVDESSNLIRFAGKDQTREFLAPKVTMVKTVYIPVQ